MKSRTLDDFGSTDGWLAVASNPAELRLTNDSAAKGNALRMDFDFKGGGGFVVARKCFSIATRDDFTFSFSVRGACPSNDFEFKLADASSQNVWRWRRQNFEFTDASQEIKLDASEIEFAWGPAGGGRT